MAFWEVATKTLPYGLQMGERAMEREERKKEREEDIKFREKQVSLQEESANIARERADREKAKFEADQIVKRFSPQIQRIMDEYNQGQDDMKAAFQLNQIYRQLPNGDEAQIIPNIQSNPQVLQMAIEQGMLPAQYANTPILAMSKKYGMRPYNSMKEVLFDAASDLGMTNITNMIMQRNQLLANKQAEATRPENVVIRRDRDGNKVAYVQQWGISGDGSIVSLGRQIDPNYVFPEDEEEKITRVTGLEPGSKESREAYKKKVFGIPTEREFKIEEAKNKRQAEKENLQIEKLKRELEGDEDFTPSQRISLMKMAQENYDREYPIHKLKNTRPKDAPTLRDYYIQNMEQMKEDLGITKKKSAETATGLPGEAVKVPIKKPTEKAKSKYPSPSQGGKPPMKGARWSPKYQSLVLQDERGEWRIVEGSQMHGKEVTINGVTYVWDSNATNKTTGQRGAWRRVERR